MESLTPRSFEADISCNESRQHVDLVFSRRRRTSSLARAQADKPVRPLADISGLPLVADGTAANIAADSAVLV